MKIAGRKVKIGPVRFRLTRKGPRGQWGHIDMPAQMIYLNGKPKADIQAATLVHECVHGILLLGQYQKESDNENLVDCLANGFVQLMRDNPWIMEAIGDAR